MVAGSPRCGKSSDRVDVLFNVTTQNDESHGDWLSDPYLGDAKITRFVEQSRHDNWWQSAVTVTADLGFAELKSASAYFQRHMTYECDNMTYEQYKSKYTSRLLPHLRYTPRQRWVVHDQHRVQRPVAIPILARAAPDFHGHEPVAVDRRPVLRARARQLVLRHRESAVHEHQRVHRRQRHGLRHRRLCLAPTNIEYVNNFDRVVRQTAAFGEISYKLTEPWTVTAGGRWFKYNRSLNQNYELPQGIPVNDPGDNERNRQ